MNAMDIISDIIDGKEVDPQELRYLVFELLTELTRVAALVNNRDKMLITCYILTFLDSIHLSKETHKNRIPGTEEFKQRLAPYKELFSKENRERNLERATKILYAGIFRNLAKEIKRHSTDDNEAGTSPAFELNLN